MASAYKQREPDTKAQCSYTDHGHAKPIARFI